MATEKELQNLRNAIISAENSIRTAKQLLSAMLGEKDLNPHFSPSMVGLGNYEMGETHIVEVVFTGESMLGSDGNTYPVPQNYASKSLLVQ